MSHLAGKPPRFRSCLGFKRASWMLLVLHLGTAWASGWMEPARVTNLEITPLGNDMRRVEVTVSESGNPDGCAESSPLVFVHIPRFVSEYQGESSLEILRSTLSSGEPVSLKLSGCQDGKPRIQSVMRKPGVASTVARTAIYVFNTDFSHDLPIEAFSGQELAILADHRNAVTSMVRAALGVQHSVGGAQLAAYFNLKECLPQLRWQLLNPGRTYGWEGPDYSDESAYLADNQYVYHSVYLAAIESITGRPLRETVQLKAQERETIEAIAADPDNESHYWARWLLDKLAPTTEFTDGQ